MFDDDEGKKIIKSRITYIDDGQGFAKCKSCGHEVKIPIIFDSGVKKKSKKTMFKKIIVDFREKAAFKTV